jgi:selenocysteine lyase/cysteine desulfurase
LVLIENATFGINAVLKSDLPFMKNGGSILCTTLAYGSVRHTLEQAAIQHGMQVRK